MSDRHLKLLTLLLDHEELTILDMTKRSMPFYDVANVGKALLRDLQYLVDLQAISFHKREDEKSQSLLTINLDWPTTITETQFFEKVKAMPKGKTHRFLSSGE